MSLLLTDFYFARRLFARLCEQSEATQPISMGAMFNNFILRLITIVTRQPISDLALRLRSWIAAPPVAARDDEIDGSQGLVYPFGA